MTRPYSMLRDVLRFTLEQVERDLSAHPNDTELNELKVSAQRRLALLEGVNVVDDYKTH